ncbi:MAG: amidase, partial [Pacificimonas sp.]
MTELTDLTLAAMRGGLRDKSFSATELTEAHVTVVEAARALNAFTVETPDVALAAARAADDAIASGNELKPLAGIPLGIKDLFCTEGVETTAGSNILKGFTPPYESTISANLKAAGAGMLGKLNMDEFAMGSSNETSAWGDVVNP